MKRTPFILLAIVVLTAVLVGAASGATPTVVSYQGQVKVGGAAFDGAGYFKFAVVNQAGNDTYWSNDGSSSGGGEPTLAISLTVSKGLFNVLLGDTSQANMTQALSSAAFTGADRYLRVWFSSDGSSFTLLSPDRRIATVPYALRAEKEGNLITVAKSGGDFTSIQAALNSITDAGSANRYLVRVGPGVYNEQVTMEPYVDIEGSGELVTRITYQTDHTLAGASDAEARFLTAELAATSNVDNCAISNTSASPRLTHVTVIAARASAGAGSITGVCNLSFSSPVMTDMTISLSAAVPYNQYGIRNSSSSPVMSRIKVTVSSSIASANNGYGVYNTGGSPIMTAVTSTATGGDGSRNCGVYNDGSSPTMANVTAAAVGGSSSANCGVTNYYSSPVWMTNVVATASGGSGSTSYGVDNFGLAATMRQVVASASGGSTAIGVRNWCGESTLTGVTASASGASYNYGVYSVQYCGMALPTLENVTATASGGLENQGVHLGYSILPATITGLIANASGGSAKNWGLAIYGNAASAPVTVNQGTLSGSGTDGSGVVVVTAASTIGINDSEISGSTNTIKISDTPTITTTIKVGGSQLAGGGVAPASGTITCTGAYDGNYAPLGSNCLKGHTVLVGPVGTAAQNGTALLNALAGISGATTSNTYLLKIEPGLYDVGTSPLTMKSYVDIAGSGESATKITGAGSASSGTGTVVGASDAELRFLTVMNTGGDESAIAIFNGSAAPRLTHVSAGASGGTRNYGVFNNSSSPAMQDVTASATGGNESYGVFNTSNSSPAMQNVAASASGGIKNSTGVINVSSSPTMQDVTASASGGGNFKYGVFNADNSSPTMRDVTASASGVNDNYSVYNYESSPMIENSSLSASGGTSNYGVYNEAASGSYTVRIHNSQVTASTVTISSDAYFTTLVGASLLAGDAVTGGGTIICAGVYDESYVFYSGPACP